MDPTALMQSLMDVVAGIEVTAQDSTEVLSDQVLDHFSRSRVMVLIVANAGSGDAPDVAVGTIFSPSRLIGLHGRTGADRRFESSKLGLHLFFDPMQELHNLSISDLYPIQREQVRLDLSNGPTQ